MSKKTRNVHIPIGGPMVEVVDTLDSKSSAVRRVGSSPIWATDALVAKLADAPHLSCGG